MTNLNDFINQTYHQYQVESAKQKKQQQELEQAENQKLIDEFAETLTGLLGLELITTLNLEYKVGEFRGNKVVSAIFTDPENQTRWHLEQDRYKNYALEAKGSSELKGFEGFRYYYKQSINSRSLATQIGVAMAEVRMQIWKKDREREQALLEEEEKRRTRIEQEERRRNEEAPLLAEEKRIHAEIEAMVEQERQKRLAEAWRWIEGKTIVYYGIRWQTGQTWEYGEITGDYESGYSTVDHLDENGYITVYPRYSGLGNVLKLDLDRHRPIWERFEANSLEDIPEVLRDDLYLEVKGIGWKRSKFDNEYRFFYDSEGLYRITLEQDSMPRWWIRELVDENA